MRSPEKTRSFVSIPIPADIARGLLKAAREPIPKGACGSLKWQAVEKIHLTLLFLGNCSPSEIARLDELLREITKTMRPFTMCVETIEPFPRRKPHTISALLRKDPALEQLYEQVREAVLSVPIEIQQHRFTPHLTLARNNKNIPAPCRQTSDKLELTAQVSEIQLMKSILNTEGAIHKVMHRYALTEE